MIGFGIDVGGLSGKGTHLAVAIANGRTCECLLVKGSVFGQSAEGNACWQERMDLERSILLRMSELHPVTMDVPIDLQDLLRPERSEFVWQLTRRPADRAFGGLSPLADRLGSCVARVKAVLEDSALNARIGRSIFETYPAANLELLGLPHRRYKNGVESAQLRESICNSIGLSRFDLQHDELDAVICALSAVASREFLLDGDDLNQVIAQRTGLDARRSLIPSGYRLIKGLPFSSIKIGQLGADSGTDWLVSFLQEK